MSPRVFSFTKGANDVIRRRKNWLIGGAVLVLLVVVIVLLAIFIPRWAGQKGINECRKRSFGLDSFVCVCTAEYCDQIEEVGNVNSDEVVYFLTSRDQHRLQRHSTKLSEHIKSDSEAIEMEVRIDTSVTFQSVMGFGGAFSDAVGIVLDSLNPKAKMELLRAYYDKNHGIRYTIGRVPIASTDFSTRIYSYADIPDDFDMKQFGLAFEDYNYKIPHLLAAKEMAGESLRLYASPWSAPWWMKETEKMEGGGLMKGTVMGANDTYYRAYAKYFRLFFEEYAKKGVHFWGLTLENESGLDTLKWWQGMHFSPEDQRQFAYYLLSPELKKSEVTKNLKIMAHDEQRETIGKRAEILYANVKDESSVIDGLAVHWYSFDSYTPLEEAHKFKPEKFILGSEASCGDQANGEFRGPQLGNWTRGWSYGHDILQDMSHWVVGWVDWNLCLDLDGGPNWYKNTIDAAIIVNSTAQEFYKQPLFYFLAHFSRFLPRDSMRVLTKLYDAKGKEVPTVDGFFLKEKGLVEHIAFRTPDGHLVVIIINGDAHRERLMRIRLGNNKIWGLQMPADSIITAILKEY